MKSKKLPQFELTNEGEIHNVTFNIQDSTFIEKQKEIYKLLTENTRTKYYIVDKDGNYTLLNKDEL
jgi:hypothetical protein